MKRDPTVGRIFPKEKEPCDDIVIITDQHFGARKNSKLFHDYFLKFYDEIFFPYLETVSYTHLTLPTILLV